MKSDAFVYSPWPNGAHRQKIVRIPGAKLPAPQAWAANAAAESTAVWWIINVSTSKQFDSNLFWGERCDDVITKILEWLQSFGLERKWCNSLISMKWFSPVFSHLFRCLVPAHSPGLPPPLRSYFRGLHLSLSCSLLLLTSRYFED